MHTSALYLLKLNRTRTHTHTPLLINTNQFEYRISIDSCALPVYYFRPERQRHRWPFWFSVYFLFHSETFILMSIPMRIVLISKWPIVPNKNVCRRFVNKLNFRHGNWYTVSGMLSFDLRFGPFRSSSTKWFGSRFVSTFCIWFHKYSFQGIKHSMYICMDQQ